MLAGFGEILLRLSPPANELPFQTPSLRTYVAGAEANVLTQLARLGHDVTMLSAVPANGLGDGVCRKLREQGVDVSRVRRSDIGRLGLYLVTDGVGVRSSHVVYDRDATSFQRTAPEEWPWDDLLAGVDWLHVSGINAALGEASERSLAIALDAAKAQGVTVSFDCNYRENLWRARGCDPVPILKALIAKADFLFGNHRDISLLSGKNFDGAGPDRRRHAAEEAFAMFPNLGGIACTARHAHDADRHSLSARVDRPDSWAQTDEVQITRIVDRIGGGDAFCAGILHGQRSGYDDEATARTGLALGVLKHTLPGDAALFEQTDVDSYLSGQFDVRR